MNIYNLKPILALTKEPEIYEELNAWVQQKDICTFLADEIRDENIILYAALPHVFICSILIPQANYCDSDIENLMHWDHKSLPVIKCLIHCRMLNLLRCENVQKNYLR